MAKVAVDVLARVRALMKTNGTLSALIVPWTDAHNSEYLAECDRLRAVLSGFTGSAGTAIITETQACLWTDGRYYLQARAEMDSRWTLMKENLPDTPTHADWLCSTLPQGSTVAVDPSLISNSHWVSLNDELKAGGHNLTGVEGQGLVEQVWDERPPRPTNKVSILPIKYTGRSTEQKLKDVRVAMAKSNASALVVSALDEVAWTLNMRGSDIPFNPVFFAYLVITKETSHLFIENIKLTEETNAYLLKEKVQVHPYEAVTKFISTLVPSGENGGARVWFGTCANRALTSSVPKKAFFVQPSPVALMKAIKNEVEAIGMRNAHVRDGAAVCRYLAYLEETVGKGEKVTEASGARVLEGFRSEMDHYMGLSFETISSVGPNGAIIHYKPSTENSEKDLPITTDAPYLCDSGGQYLDGTTDITRTIHLGTPTQHEMECFTRVLKGQLHLAAANFPERIRGNCLDGRARQFLWDVGLDYGHGTGHGIGSYLCVHEGPMGISWRMYPDDPGLQAGMFLSNEPGYYENGKFGVRLENIVQIVPSEVGPNFLKFETVTLVPIQTKMIVRELLTEKERKEINEYHRECREKVGPVLKKAGLLDVVAWLNKNTEEI